MAAGRAAGRWDVWALAADIVTDLPSSLLPPITDGNMAEAITAAAAVVSTATRAAASTAMAGSGKAPATAVAAGLSGPPADRGGSRRHVCHCCQDIDGSARIDKLKG